MTTADLPEAVKLADQQTALTALTAVFAAFGHLPAASISLSPYTPQRIDIGFHDHGSLAHFETWREALGILPEAVSYREFTLHVSLNATVQFAGADVRLIGYATPLPDTADQAPAADEAEGSDR
ncbi:hypothetical protein RKE29_02140 [Streptomyces sp. B1866]|uniref:hypothetical protein n=1 Tax=Streptomyces sp. B1866 TaxID=3075431 RepID=UPI00288DD695|nr:hypothetical protein [Streptomyces sp. B1866]MDT3395461.1 hypothetical protein [Streptomyces sp. B1866]